MNTNLEFRPEDVDTQVIIMLRAGNKRHFTELGYLRGLEHDMIRRKPDHLVVINKAVPKPYL